MANPVNPTAAVGVNPLSDSVPQSVSTKSSAIGRTVALVDAMVQTQSEDHECGELSAEKGSYFQRLRSYLLSLPFIIVPLFVSVPFLW